MEHSTIDELLQRYPKRRPPLSSAHQAIYTREYKANRSGENGLSNVVAKLENWMHREIANGRPVERILELGAGTLNHLKFENSWATYDVVEPFQELWQGNNDEKCVSRFYGDLSEVPCHENYDRIISVAVLEHLVALPSVVAQSALLLAPNGRFQAGIPSEGGGLWGLAWRMTTALSYRLRTGLSYRDLMRHEHVNDATEILAVLKYFFSEVRVRRFPLPWHHLSFYTVLNALDPQVDRCVQYLSSDPANQPRHNLKT